MTKDYCPGYFELVSGGVTGADESDLLNAQRELEEELGIKDVEFKDLFKFKFQSDVNKVWGSVYLVRYDGDVKLQEEEVADLLMWTKEEIDKKIEEGEKITPDSILAYQ